MEDTTFQNLALRHRDYGKLLDSCLIWSDYLQINDVPSKRKIVYRSIATHLLGSPNYPHRDSLVTKVCFNREGIAIQSFVLHSNLSKKLTKDWLLNVMKYRAEPAKNDDYTCPQCGLITFRFTGK